MPKKILFMDNDLNFLDVHTRLLQQKGYEVIKATSVSEAKAKLDTHHAHAAIFDIRVEDDEDEQDISGLTLAQEEAYQPIPKIILTAFKSLDYVRVALGVPENGLPPAFNYIGKDEGPNKILAAVNQLFEQKIVANWHLKILWRNQLSFSQLVSLINSDFESSSPSPAADELEHLFRQLFHQCSQITIQRILTQHPSRIALTAFGFSEKGDRNSYIIICGRREIIQAEEKTYRKFASKVIGGGGTVQIDTAQTMHFAATLYTITRGNLEEITTFSTFYRRHPSEQVVIALDHLFDQTLRLWYQQAGYSKEGELLTLFFQRLFDLAPSEVKIANLKQQLVEVRQNGLAAGLHELKQISPRLTALLTDFELRFDAPTRHGVSPGALYGDNILVDPAGNTWLIDFSQVSPGLLMRDFLSLEMTIKLNLLETLDAPERYRLEEALLDMTQLDQPIEFETPNSEIAKAYHAIVTIRRQAARIIGSHPEPYWAGLYFYALNHLTTYNVALWYTQAELMPFFQAFISAALLYQRLTPTMADNLPAQAITSLWIDEVNREMWVEGRQVMLTPQEYDLLLYLYQQNGQLCTRAMIAENVFDVNFDPNLMDIQRRSMEEGRINSTMSRLRKKLESDHRQPKYITAIRGQGYKLEIK